MAGIKIVDLPALGRDLAATDLLELSLAGGTGSRKITGQEIINASKLNVGTTPIINGTAGRLLFQSTGNTLQQSGNLFWDDTNGRLGIGTSSPATNKFLDVLFNVPLLGGTGISIRNTNNTGYSELVFDNDTTPTGFGGFVFGYSGTSSATGANVAYFFQRRNAPILFGTNDTNRMTIYGNGNVAINTTTDAGFKFDVNGTAVFRGTTTFNGDIRCSSIAALINQNIEIHATWAGSGYVRIRTITNTPQVLIVQPETNLTLTSGTHDTQRILHTFAPTSGTAVINALTLNQTINQTGGANGITRGLYVNPTLTAAADFRAIETTAGNVIFNGGNVGIGTSSPSTTLHVVGQTTISSSLSISGGFVMTEASNVHTFTAPATNRTIRFITNSQSYSLFSTGNFAIGTTTDAGYRLDVNGTAIVRGILTINDNVQGKISADNQYLNLYHNGGSQSILSFGFGSSIGASGYLRINQNAGDPAGTTSGTIHRYDFNSTITNSTGTAQWNFQSLRPNYNFTGTYSGTVRGFYYNPTLTSMTGVTHFAFHSTSGRVRFEGLPTSPTGLNAGDIYNDGGILKIV